MAVTAEEDKKADSHKPDDITLDFSRITGFFKKKKEHTSEENTPKKEPPTGESSLKKEQDKHPSSAHTDELSLTFGDVKSGAAASLSFVKKYSMVLLILIPILFSIFVRIHPVYLPITDQFAMDSIDNGVRSQLEGQISQQYPNLPATNRAKLVAAEFQRMKDDQRDQYDAQVKQLSGEFKKRFQDDTGTTYLIGIDEWQWHRYAEDIIDHGFMGDKIVDGQYVDMHMLAPQGRVIGQSFHPYFIAYLYKVMHFFSKDATILAATFISPVIFAALTILPTFFLGRRIAGPFAGFFAAMVMAIHPVLAGRTIAGYSDTDIYSIFFPMLILWLFVEALAAEKTRTKIILTVLTGLAMGVFSFAWEGWWYTFDFLLAVIGLYALYFLILHRKQLGTALKGKESQQLGILIALFAAASFAGVAIGTNPSSFFEAFRQPFSIIQLKTASGDFGIWPNVYTTVAELNPPSLMEVINSLGGKFLLLLAALSILYLFYRGVRGVKNSGANEGDNDGQRRRSSSVKVMAAFLLLVWFGGTLFASTKGIRFVMLILPAFSLGLAVSFAAILHHTREWFSKELHVPALLTSAVFIIIFLLFIGVSPIPPFCTHGMCASSKATSYGSVPSYEDGWDAAMKHIKDASKENAIVNSWWDFGHWFKAGSDRAVTFDGASQNRPQAHWVGKVLLTDNETIAVGILRMLDCGGTDAFDLIEKEVKSPNEAVKLTYKIIVEDKETARQALQKKKITGEKAEAILNKSHCDPPEDFFITSTDMVGKSGVWAHFGSWDFERAAAWKNIRDKTLDEAKPILASLGYSDKEAESIYYDVQSLATEQDATTWISPWPGYYTTTDCEKRGGNPDLLRCPHQLGNNQLLFDVNLTTMDVFVENSREHEPPYSIVYMDENNKFKEKRFSGKTLPVTLALVNAGSRVRGVAMDPKLGGSMFTRLYYFQDNTGLPFFEFFDHQTTATGWEIYTWKVDWSGTADDEEPRAVPLVERADAGAESATA